MSEMIEAVARAIWEIRREEEDRCDMELEDMGASHSVWTEARAATAAMSDPSETMLKAARKACMHVTQGEDMNAKIWRAMIDSALVEETGQ